MRQISLFDGKHQFKITKPIRLIELFAGIGSQAKALRNLGANFEHYRICEFDKYAVQSYNEIHGTSFETSDITKIKAADLGITETDKYEYIMTYSFPCQDLSIAGKQSGMAKGIGTRSGLLWEVERLLKECKELPQVLLMENVPQVHGKKNIDSFNEWCAFLENKGYKNYWQDLNAKNFGVPQNRKRCFMVSVLGNYYYDFPKEIPLKLRLKDMLEKTVDEKYYLSAKMLEYLKLNNDKQKNKGNGFKFEPTAGNENAKAITTRCGASRMTDNFIEEKCEVVATLDIPGRFESACRVHGIDGIAPACNTCGGGGHETKIAEPICLNSKVDGKQPKERFFRQAIETANENECENGDTINAFNKTVDKTGISPTITTRPEGFKTAILPIVNYRVRKLTPKECWRLMGFTDSDFDKAKASGVSNSQLYKQAGNSIVVDVLMAIFKEIL